MRRSIIVLSVTIVGIVVLWSGFQLWKVIHAKVAAPPVPRSAEYDRSASSTNDSKTATGAEQAVKTSSTSRETGGKRKTDPKNSDGIIQASIAATATENPVMSARIRAVMANPTKAPPWKVLMNLSKSDLPHLKNLYTETVALSNRCALTYGLSMVGDEESVDLLKETIFANRHAAVLFEDDERTINASIIGLGFLAKKHDSAFEVLKNGVEYPFWLFNRTWRRPGEQGGDRDVTRLVDFSIQALASSGRPEVPALLEALRQRDGEYLKRLDSALVTAAFQFETVNEKGMEYYQSQFFTDGGVDAYIAWEQTPNGQSWQRWKMETRRRTQPHLFKQP